MGTGATGSSESFWKDGEIHLGKFIFPRRAGQKCLCSDPVMLDELISCKCQGEVIEKCSGLVPHSLLCNLKNRSKNA